MSSNGFGSDLIHLIFRWWDIADDARRARELPPEQQERVVRFGVLAVIYALLTAACACALLLFKIGFSSGIILGIIILIVAIAIGVFGTLICFITTLVYWFCQLSVNKRAGTWITFVLVLIGFAAAVGLPLFFFM